MKFENQNSALQGMLSSVNTTRKNQRIYKENWDTYARSRISPALQERCRDPGVMIGVAV